MSIGRNTLGERDDERRRNKERPIVADIGGKLKPAAGRSYIFKIEFLTIEPPLALGCYRRWRQAQTRRKK
ncbi:hypothetical protein PoB_003864600 [Plakobranchus ocellatus]|uniref:Uncharacterized protein n=1 Tax=Plakobranchus ocellatus TaxID=259542 RepID=A0AAV4AVH0_9GAST|nr:hypothetical protein PoB_003864600 [Plakobranchus ocellatus]